MTTMVKTGDEMVRDGVDMIRREYMDDVHDMAREIKSEIEKGEIEDRDQLYSRIHDAVDGTQWVIYTHKAQMVLLVSDNDGAYADNYGSEGMVTDGAINWSALAFAAMEQDLIEWLDAEGVDVNGDTKEEMLPFDETETESEDENADSADVAEVLGLNRVLSAEERAAQDKLVHDITGAAAHYVVEMNDDGYYSVVDTVEREVVETHPAKAEAETRAEEFNDGESTPNREGH